MKKKCLMAFLGVTLVMCSCGKKDYPELSAQTVTMEFPAGSSSVFQVEIPSNLVPILVTDNYYYTGFQNDTSVTLYTSPATVGYTYSDEYGLYIGSGSVLKETDAGHITFKFPEEYADRITELVSRGTVVQDTICDMYDDWKLKKMPPYEPVEDMVMLDGNLYTLADAEVNKIGGHVAVKWDGADFLEVFTQDGFLEDLAPEWMHRLTVNETSGSHPLWMKSGDVFYSECGSYCMAAKQLTGNQWYVYFGTMKYRDHMLHGCNKVKYQQNGGK